MKIISKRLGVFIFLMSISFIADAQSQQQFLTFQKFATVCAPDIHPVTLKGIVSTESAGNPYAIGVVGGNLKHQPRNLTEAVTTAQELERRGFNFSMGLGQINRYNLKKYSETYETIFDPCRNLKASSAILKDCYLRAKIKISDDQQALRAAFSCYYSGNFTRGFFPDKAGKPSYVQKVVINALKTKRDDQFVPAVSEQPSDHDVTLRNTNQLFTSSNLPAFSKTRIQQNQLSVATHKEKVFPHDVVHVDPTLNAQEDTPFVQIFN